MFIHVYKCMYTKFTMAIYFSYLNVILFLDLNDDLSFPYFRRLINLHHASTIMLYTKQNLYTITYIKKLLCK